MQVPGFDSNIFCKYSSVKAAVPIINNSKLIRKCLPLLVSSKESTSAILSHADSQMLKTRRDDIIPYLAKEFKQLRNYVRKGSEHLFDDNITY